MISAPRTLTTVVRRSRRAVLRRRRPLAFALTVVAVLLGVHAVRPPSAHLAAMLVAAHDLPAGDVVAPGDVTTEQVPPGVVPAGAVAAPVGRTLATAMRRGEPITDVRLVGPSLTATDPDLVAVPVRFPDAGEAALLRVGDLVQLLAAQPTGGRTYVVASAVRVLGLPSPDVADDVGGVASDGRIVILGVSPDALTEVVSAAAQGFLTFAFAR
jgi:Flp pilus assembly protein CpaB